MYVVIKKDGTHEAFISDKAKMAEIAERKNM